MLQNWLRSIALLPLVSGLGGNAICDPATFTAGFRVAMQLSTGLPALGGVLAWFLVCDDYKLDPRHVEHSHCAIDGPPLRHKDGSTNPVTDVLPTGLVDLDRAIGIGGWPRGRIARCFGPEGVGVSTLSSRLWPRHNSADVLLRSGAFDALALDSVPGLYPSQGYDAAKRAG